MKPVLLFDFSKVILFAKDKDYNGSLNGLHKKLSPDASYKFNDHFELDMELVDFLVSLKEKATLYMYTSGTIQDVPEIAPTVRELFIKVFSAEKMGTHKEMPESYLKVAEAIGKQPQEILFVDDKEVNIKTARSVNMEAFHYKSLSELKDFLSSKGVT